MAEKILTGTLEENIPLPDVLRWICNDSLEIPQEKFSCSRGEFVLHILNFLRQSTTKIWQQSTTVQSPMKQAISKPLQGRLSKSLYSPKCGSERRNTRRVELFPSSKSHSVQTVIEPERDGLSSLRDSKREVQFPTETSNNNESSLPYGALSPVLSKETCNKASSKSFFKHEENPLKGTEIMCPATSSPMSASVTSDGSPFHSPFNKRFFSCKSNERRSSPVLLNSPDHQYKTPSRNNSMCLGDFIVKGGKGPKSQTKKRFSLSPPISPVETKDYASGDQELNSHSNKKKHRRRINPTKVSLENVSPSAQSSFQEMQVFGSTSCSLPVTSPFQTPVKVEPVGASQSFSEERNLLRQERLKLQSQGELLSSASLLGNPVGLAKLHSLRKMVVPDPLKVTNEKQLSIFCEIYCCVLSANLVPNIMTELHFIISLLVIQCNSKLEDDFETARTLEDHMQNVNLRKELKSDVDDIKHDPATNSSNLDKDGAQYPKNEYGLSIFGTVHNCVFFATSVLQNQVDVLKNFDRITLKLLSESDRIASFSPSLKDLLFSLYSTASSRTRAQHSSASVSYNSTVNGNVSFQSETDNCSNFPSAQCFSNFRKQRDGFYELIRIWEANHLKKDWCFMSNLGNRVRSLLLLCSDPINLMHFARLFRLQLISAVCGGYHQIEEGPEDLQFLEGLRGVDRDKLNRLRERLVTPYKGGGPRPPPSFPGSQEFYHDFIVSSSHSSFLQHLQDSLISHLLDLDQTAFLASDTEDSDSTVDSTTQQAYLSCVSKMRVLAKFLGFIVFLPYQRNEMNLPQNIWETEISVRCKVMPPLNILQCVIDAYKSHRLVVTIPWVVKFMGMMDKVSCELPVYQTVLQLLLRLYVDLQDGSWHDLEGRKLSLPPQTTLLLRLCLGWLFDAPFIQDSIFYSWRFNLDRLPSLAATEKDVFICSSSSLDVIDTSASSSTILYVDPLNIIDSEVLYTLCPFLLELKALLASTSMSECAPNGSVRHITPVSTTSSLQSSVSSVKQLELKLEESFFHGLPTSVRRTVDFVAERVTSSCVKHICNVWLPGLKQRGVSALQEKIKLFLNEQETESTLPSLQELLRKEISDIVEQVATDLRTKCRLGVGDFCSSKCKGALMSLLSEESLSLAVCEMCISIATRTSEERVISWMQNHATLSLYSKDLQSEAEKALKNRDRGEIIISAKTSHIAPGETAAWNHDETAPSPFIMLQTLKLLVSDILNGQNTTQDHVLSILDEMEKCVSKRQDVIPAAERILALLSVDLVVSLVCHNPRLVDSALLSRLISLWKSDALRPVEDGLARLVSPRNMLLLAQSSHPTRLVWEKLAEVVAAVLKANLVTPELVENQCLAIMQQEWPQNILRCFAMCMNEVVRQYQKQKDVDYKFVLLLEWLAETMAQIDYFPPL